MVILVVNRIPSDLFFFLQFCSDIKLLKTFILFSAHNHLRRPRSMIYHEVKDDDEISCNAKGIFRVDL